MAYIKIYMKKVKTYLEEKNPERVEPFMSGAKETVKMIVSKFSEWQFFTGESYDSEAMICLMNYREDGMTPYFIFFKDGLKEEKL